MGRTAGVIALAASLALLTGCGATRLLGGTTSAPADSRTYLAKLSAAQAKLAATERRIPRRPRTGAALARSIELLAGATSGLANDLEVIRPPAAVRSLHSRLVAIVRRYSARLGDAARSARAPRGLARAGSALISATDQASRAFTATVGRITTELAR